MENMNAETETQQAVQVERPTYANSKFRALRALSLAGEQLVAQIKKSISAGNYRYADIGQYTSSIKCVFAQHGLIALQPICSDDQGEQYIHTIIYHESLDEPICESKLYIKPYVDTSFGGKLHQGQRIGAGITYARKYALQSILCMAPDEQDLDLDHPKYAAPAAQTAQKPVKAQAMEIKPMTERERALIELRTLSRVPAQRKQLQEVLAKTCRTESDIVNMDDNEVLHLLAELKAALEQKEE